MYLTGYSLLRAAHGSHSALGSDRGAVPRPRFERLLPSGGHPAGQENQPYDRLNSGPCSLMEFQSINGISVKKCYIDDMNKLTSSSTAEHIRTLARTFHVSY